MNQPNPADTPHSRSDWEKALGIDPSEPFIQPSPGAGSDELSRARDTYRSLLLPPHWRDALAAKLAADQAGRGALGGGKSYRPQNPQERDATPWARTEQH